MDAGNSEDRGRELEIALILALARALHVFGAPAPRVEQTLARLARRFGREGQFFATPTSIFAAFGEPGDQRTSLLRVNPGEIELGRRVEVDSLIDDVLNERISVGEAHRKLRAILDERQPYGAGLTTLCFGLSSAAACRFFGGGWNEIAVSLVAGLVVGTLAWPTGRSTSAARVLVILSAFSVAVLAVLAARTVRPLSTYTVIVSGLIVLIPGLSLTTAMNELALGHLASGTARFMGSLLVFLQLIFGVAIGRRAADLLPATQSPAASAALPAWTLIPALLVAPLCYTVLLRAQRSDFGWILGSGVVSFLVARAGAGTLGLELGTFVASLVVGAGSNLYARSLRRPSAVTMVPGILLLVPGSLGFQSFSSLLERDVVSGVETGFRMVLVAIALVAGLLVANVLVQPRNLEREA